MKTCFPPQCKHKTAGQRCLGGSTTIEELKSTVTQARARYTERPYHWNTSDIFCDEAPPPCDIETGNYKVSEWSLGSRVELTT